MKLANYNYEHKIEFQENTYTVISIENQKCFREYLAELIGQCKGYEGPFVLSEEGSILHMDEKTAVIADYYSLEDRVGTYDSKLQGELKKSVLHDTLNEQGQNLLSQISAFGASVCLSTEYKIEFQEPSLQNLLKFLKFKISLDSSLIDQLLDFMKVSNWLLGIDVFVFVNFSSFFTTEEFNAIVNDCLVLKYNLIFIEPHPMAIEDDRKRTVIIDKDLCEIF